ncbi:MAG TPA: secondary thiamine-phosphate synthase enzyme YjbQ [Bryobacteraceae bacterium]|nr:secondary thiamine-phosphate synthase enzyme YjbQ [Bryobacteraceae bacterium]HPT28189.1 secondary thiamine-phosphate synthase enzyme YjbQ [Bryobacteraceae bacterium]
MVQTAFTVPTRGLCDVIDITDQIESAVTDSGVTTGVVNVSGQGSTLGLTTIEFESGAVLDLKKALSQIAPMNDDYAHNARWGDHNGYAHLRSALMGTSKIYPIVLGKLHLGTWQQVVLCDFDERPRQREITVTVIGE